MAIKPISQRSIDRITSAQVITTVTSGIKELLDNALDAGATVVDIRIMNQGIDGFSVQDNGSGIDEADFDLLAVSHATSKIAEFADLARVKTLGFRGEASASLSVMGDLEITTNTGKAPTGFHLVFDHAGHVFEKMKVPAPKGTMVEVSSSFANLKARRLQLEQTIDSQYRALLALVQEYAMFTSARITVANISKNQKHVASRSQGADMMQRIATVFRGQRTKQVTPVHFTSEEMDFPCEVTGVLSRPQSNTGIRGAPFQYLAVNSRPIKHKRIADVIKDVYRQVNPNDAVLYILDLQIDPSKYDVNVAPDKRSIMIHREKELLDASRQRLTQFFDTPERSVPRSEHVPPAKRVRNSSISFASFAGSGTLISQGFKKDASSKTSAQMQQPTEEEASETETDSVSSRPSSRPSSRELVRESSPRETPPVSPGHSESSDFSEAAANIMAIVKEDPYELEMLADESEPVQVQTMRPPSRLMTARNKTLNSHVHLPSTIEDVADAVDTAVQSEEKPSKHLSPWAVDEKDAEERLSLTIHKQDFDNMEIVGQFNLGFILVVNRKANSDDLFVIDQHASDEIYNFERLQNTTVSSRQPLVVPFPLELSAVEELVIQENSSVFENNGFSIRIDRNNPPGKQCFLTSVPFSKSTSFDETDVLELLSKSKHEPHPQSRCSKLRAMFAMRACRSSIMIGRPLSMKRMNEVVKQMGTSNKPWNCPHGRPTSRHITTLR